LAASNRLTNADTQLTLWSRPLGITCSIFSESRGRRPRLKGGV
jgi:hypothetical protein